MKIGIQVGKVFIGIRTKGGATIAPFTENIEAGMPYRVTGSDFQDILSTLRGEYTDTNLIELFASIAEIFAPVDAIASRAIGAKFVWRRKSDNEEVVDNEWLNKLLETPNPFQNFQQLIYEALVYELVTGKEFLYKNVPATLKVDYKNIAALWNLPADKITIDLPKRMKLFSSVKASDVVLGYVLEKDSLDEQRFSTESVMYRKAHNLKWKAKKIEGRSPLLSAEKAIANLIAVYEARNVVYVKRGMLGMWVSKKTDASGTKALNPGEKKEARDDIDSNYGLSKKKSTVGITNQPIDFIKTSMSIQELQPFEETLADAAAIYAVLGVPRSMMPKNEGSTYENAKADERGLYQNKVIPFTLSWCKTFTSFIGADKWGYYLDAKFDHIEALQENKKESAETNKTKIESFTKLYKDGGITHNQWLIALGYEARGTEFDKYINELENVPMAVKIGVGGTQAMQSIIADTRLTEEARAAMLVLLFGITEEQARQVVVTAPLPETPAVQPANN